MCDKCSEPFRKLEGKKIVIGVTASISLYRVPDLVRDIVKQGGSVVCAMSDAAQKLISPEIFRWASANDPVTIITGKVEHISLFSDPRNTVLVIVPATYNTLGKLASGISDEIPSLMFAYAFGHGVPVIVAPAMHEDMLRNPIMVDNIRRLSSLGVRFISPRIEDEKAKISENVSIIDEIYRSFNHSSMEGKKALVISGRSEEHIDPVRVISNRSTGTTGYWLARNLYRLGASHVTYIGNTNQPLPPYVNHIPAVSTDDFYRETKAELRSDAYDIVFVPAALSDFSVTSKDRKIESGKEVSIQLKPRKKLLDTIRAAHKGTLVSFKLGHDAGNTATTSTQEYIVFNAIRSEGRTFGDNSAEYRVFGGEGTQDIVAHGKEEATWRLILHVAGE
ncbi:MAG: bifunctional phosphopantothenoylcysteine decarboxylase/phosphopantothenate--cysteine ligase CoaBC [Candidatus Thermoplasmatota archaeon]|nr:bifunctional phosphopantothenoylcysteine decarboxylase/phosphopantothenate--cysteine ligase CoaBC [Candidatus Thermoplasmatota archaeon]